MRQRRGSYLVSLKRDIKKDIAAAKKIHIPWWGALCTFLGTLLIGSIFSRFGILRLVSPALNSLIVVAFVLAMKWKQWRQGWFWAAVGIMTILHVLLIILVPWTTKRTPAIVMGIIYSLDICLMLGLFVFLQHLWARRSRR